MSNDESNVDSGPNRKNSTKIFSSKERIKKLQSKSTTKIFSAKGSIKKGSGEGAIKLEEKLQIGLG